MTALHTLIETGLYSKLDGDATLTGLVNHRIYDTLGPDGAALPYVVFQQTAGGGTNDTPRRNADLVYRVEAIAASAASARQVSGAIDDALHNGELTITGWSNWRLMAETMISLIDTVEGKQFYRKGAFYRISLDKNTIP